MNKKQNYKLPEVVLRLAEGAGLYSATGIRGPQDAVSIMAKEIATYDREALVVLNLNNKHQPINFNVASIGSLDRTVLDIPNIMKSAILSNARMIMLMHNHPSGDPTPSQIDVATTKRVIEAGKLLGIPCLDHVIVAGGSGCYFSMSENNTVNFGFDEHDPIKTAEQILSVDQKAP